MTTHGRIGVIPEEDGKHAAPWQAGALLLAELEWMPASIDTWD